MDNVPTPQAGCFVATYPNPVWQPTQCVTPPKRPLLPSQPSTVGGGGTADWAAESVVYFPTQIGRATGSFKSITGFTSETDSVYGANVFSLQLNTNTFPTRTAYTGGKSATGWEQFVFTNDGYAYIQYWLIGGYKKGCPSGIPPGGADYYGSFWQPYNHKGYVGYCYANSIGVPTPSESASNLAKLILNGYANFGSQDQVTLSVSGGSKYTNALTDNVLNLYQNWWDAEFNVFGLSNSEAIFKTYTYMSITVLVSLESQSGTPLDYASCFKVSYTYETNNMVLGTCSTNTPNTDQIAFTESVNSLVCVACPPLTGSSTHHVNVVWTTK